MVRNARSCNPCESMGKSDETKSSVKTPPTNIGAIPLICGGRGETVAKT